MDNRACILVVDDDKPVRDLLQELLDGEGHEVITAGNGRDALAEMKRHKPDLVFLDINMPEMSGLSVLSEMKRQSLDMPVIVITGYSTLDNAIQAIRSGAKEFITKPFDLPKIRILTRRYIP
ncbi:MAG TPA: sigma-54-dependent Fis family transcriptional regulator [Bacteroidetes bacterium]|nr:sigma-54-dependent Fis family transcriptional regulator [Bacteroidota bacterium]